MPTQPETQTAETIRTAFTAKRAAFIERFTNHVERNFSELVKHCPTPESLKAERCYWNSYKASPSDVPSSVGNNYRAISWYLDNDTLTLKIDKIEKDAARYADDTIDSLVEKVVNKIGNIDNVSVDSNGALAFTVRGTKGGSNVALDQNVILNVSKQHKVFNQYPARIYVDGKFISAKAFAQLS